MKISDFLSARHSGQIKSASSDSVLEFTYQPDAMTTEFAVGLRAAQADEDVSFLSKMLVMYELDWDLMDEKGAKIGTDFESLKGVPISILSAVLTAIHDSSNPEGESAA